MKPSQTSFLASMVLLVLFGAMGCDDPLEKAQVIESVRVLGARVEVVGDPKRASPAPGERARVELFVAAPEPLPALGWTLSACPIQPSNTGVSSCASAAFASHASPEPAAGAPFFEFEVPSGLDSRAPLMLAVQGRVCDGVLAQGSGLGATCTNGAPGTALSFEFAMATDGVANENPSFAEVPVLLDAAPWPATIDPCTAVEGRKIPVKSGPHTIELSSSEAAREPLTRRVSSDPPRESLLFSHFSDRVELERVFSSVAAEAPEAEARVKFEAPDGVPSGGGPTRFWFVLRDLRGGSAFMERSLCVVP